MSAASITILVLLGILALGAGFAGVWIWLLNRRVADRDATICHREVRIRHLERAQESLDNKERVEKMNSDELATFLNRSRRHPDLDDGAS